MKIHYQGRDGGKEGRIVKRIEELCKAEHHEKPIPPSNGVFGGLRVPRRRLFFRDHNWGMCQGECVSRVRAVRETHHSLSQEIQVSQAV